MPREGYQQALVDLRGDVSELGETALDQLDDGLAQFTDVPAQVRERLLVLFAWHAIRTCR